MARTQTDERQLKDRSLTGASLVPEMLFYDETANYSVNDIVFWQGDKYICTSAVTGTTESDLSNSPDLSGDWDKLKSPIYSVIPSASQIFSNTRIDIAFDTERFNSGGFSTNASGEITANVSGTFLISISSGVYNTTSARNTATLYAQIDSGSGYSDIPNLRIFNYSRDTNDGRDTASITFPYSFSTGDKLKIQIVGRSANDLQTEPDSCNITLFPVGAVSGPKGDKGDTGPSGDLNWTGSYDNSTTYNIHDVVEYNGSSYVCITNGTNGDTPPSANWELVAQKGNDGAGATLTIQEEGTSITNTPHGTLNFIGAEITASDAGAGVCDVTLAIKNKYMVPIWAEENAALADNSYEWAFGNGANSGSGNGVTIYVPSGYSCEIVAMSLCLRQGTATVQLVHNGTSLGNACNVQVSSGTRATNDSFTPVTIANGDLINFRTQAASGTGGPNVVTAYLEYTEI